MGHPAVGALRPDLMAGTTYYVRPMGPIAAAAALVSGQRGMILSADHVGEIHEQAPQ